MMVSSEWAAPNTFMPASTWKKSATSNTGAGCISWTSRRESRWRTFYLGEDGLIPLEVKFHHDPDSTHGFVCAALSSNVIHWWKNGDGRWEWEKIIDVENEPHPEWPIPLPGIISALLVSMDDRYLYITTGCTATCAKYDITDPHNPG